MSLPFIYPTDCTLIPFSALDQTGRSRTSFGDLQSLAESITTYGLIHPPLVSESAPGLFTLHAGGRRTAAMRLLGCTHIPCNVRTTVTPAHLHAIELEENESRLGMTWQEKITLIAASHNLRVLNALATNDLWTQAQSGRIFNCSRTHVANCLLLHEAITSRDPEILASPTVTDALDILVKRQETLAQSELARRTSTQLLRSTPIPSGYLSPTTSPASSYLSPPTMQETRMVAAAQTDAKVFDLSKRFVLGDSVRVVMPGMPSACVDHVVCDPPYGVDMDNMEKLAEIDVVKEEHDVTENMEMFLPFLQEAFRVVRPSGFCVFWYDLDHHNLLQTLAKDVGWKVQRWPIVWNKLHNCKNDSAQYNFTKKTEYAMVLRKPGATLVKNQPTNVVECDGKLEQQMYNNPFAKPLQVWKFIYDAIAITGQTVLDPFGGEFSSARAAINCGLLPIAIEKKEEHYNKGLNQIKDFLLKMSGGHIIFE